MLPYIIKALKPTNDLNVTMDIDDPLEMIFAQWFIGTDIGETLSKECEISIDDAMEFVDLLYGYRRKEIHTKGKTLYECLSNLKTKVEYTPKGISAASIIEKIGKRSKNRRGFSPKWLSSKILPELKRRGIIDFYKPPHSVRIYRMNSYMG